METLCQFINIVRVLNLQAEHYTNARYSAMYKNP